MGGASAGKEQPGASSADEVLPRALPPELERAEARRRMRDRFPSIEWLNKRTDDLLDVLWEFWNEDADPSQLARDGWSDHGIVVWQRPFRYDIEQAFSAEPARLDSIRQRNEFPVGDGHEYVSVPMSDADAAQWRAQQRWIVDNADLWEARNERSKLAEQLMDLDREARIQAATFGLERALLHEELQRARAGEKSAGQQNDSSKGRRCGSGAFESRDHFVRVVRVVRAAVLALRVGGITPTQSAVSRWLDEQSGLPRASLRALQTQARTWGFRSWEEVLAEVGRDA